MATSTTTTSRRRFLAASASLAAGAAAPALADTGDARIMAAVERFRLAGRTGTDDEQEAIMFELAGMRATTLAGLAAKVSVSRHGSTVAEMEQELAGNEYPCDHLELSALRDLMVMLPAADVGA